MRHRFKMEKLKTPSLRFPLFSEDWKTKPLKKIAKINPKSPDLPDSFYYIDLGAVYKGHLTDIEKISKENAPSRAQRLLNKGDILFQTVRPYQKNNYFFNEAGNYVASSGYAQLKTNEVAKFLYHYLHTPSFVNLVVKLSTGTSFPAISPSEFALIKITIPSNSEQKKIADFLSTVDQKIQQLRRKKVLLEKYKKGVMQKLFSQEIRFKDENGEDFPDWESKRIEEILDISYGKDYKNLDEGDIPLIGTGGIMGYVDDFLYDKPSVLIGRKGTIDKPQYIDEPFWTVDTLFYTKVSESVDPYFAYLLVSRINLLKYNEASGVPSLSVRALNSIMVKIPASFEEQLHIANFVEIIDRKISQLNRKIELAQTFKKGLLQQMFV